MPKTKSKRRFRVKPGVLDKMEERRVRLDRLAEQREQQMDKITSLMERLVHSIENNPSPAPPMPSYPTPDPDFLKELKQLINKYSLENGSGTPDFILVGYLADCLKAFDDAVQKRKHYYMPARSEGMAK